jgi:hypothetical protein
MEIRLQIVEMKPEDLNVIGPYLTLSGLKQATEKVKDRYPNASLVILKFLPDEDENIVRGEE